MLEKRFGSTTEAREKFKTCLRVNPRNAKVYQVMCGIKRYETFCNSLNGTVGV